MPDKVQTTITTYIYGARRESESKLREREQRSKPTASRESEDSVPTTQAGRAHSIACLLLEGDELVTV